jgi:hypothetical protein
MIGTQPVVPGYAFPTLVNASGPSLSNMNAYHGQAYDVNGSTLNNTLDDVGGSCSCCCSELMTGPTFMFMWNEGQDGPEGMQDGWASRNYWPGGSSGVYMDLMSDKMYHFNVGQHKPCEEIRGGLYSFRDSDDVDCHKYEYDWSLGSGYHWDYKSTHACGYVRGFTEPALKWALFGTTPNQTYINSSVGIGDHKYVADGGAPKGGFEYLSLCLPCMGIDDTTCTASCPNAQHYGKNTPSVPATGPGYANNVPFAGSLFQSENCASDPCSPNGLCFGPGSATGPGPTACLSSNSPLDGSGDGGADEDNVCFDCEAKAIFHPCYDIDNPQTANSGSGPNGNTNLAAAPLYQCNTIYVPGLDPDGLPLAGSSAYNSSNGGPELWAEQYNVIQDEDSWDSCCVYRTIGCVDSSYANFNPMARNGGFDCEGNPDPNNDYTYFDPNWFGTGNGAVVCQNVPTLPTGANFNLNIPPPNEFTNPAVDIACTDSSLEGNNNQPFHPLGWSNTDAYFTNTDCCTNDGCMDSGAGGTVWAPTPSHPPTSPWPGPGPYYPGYDVMIGLVPTQIQVTQSPIAATNYSVAFVNDCTSICGSPMCCCTYDIPGCMDATAGTNPDIFGNNPIYAVWNFNPYATIDDGSCFDEQPIGGCVDNGGPSTTPPLLSNVTVPPFAPQFPGIPASNFNPNANIADTSCVWSYGCPDTYANNYDPCVVNPVTAPCTATYPVVPDMALCNYDIAGAGPGCMDPQALNYNPLSTQDCVGVQPPLDFSCCIYPVDGCTDTNATNYNPLAVNDDGSCEYDISTTQEGVNWLYGSKVLLCRDPLTKEEVLMGVCDQPEIQSEIFIERGKQSVMEPNLRLGEITTMGGLINHGYKYFRIKKQ